MYIGTQKNPKEPKKTLLENISSDSGFGFPNILVKVLVRFLF